jgi:hypothetical protein
MHRTPNRTAQLPTGVNFGDVGYGYLSEIFENSLIYTWGMPYATRSIIPDAFYLCMIYTLFEDSENMHLALLFEGGESF